MMRIILKAKENLKSTLRHNYEIREEERVCMDTIREEERVRMAHNAIVILSDDEYDSGRREIPIILDHFIQNIKRKLNMFHDLSRKMKIPPKK